MSTQKSVFPQFEITVKVAYISEESQPDQGYHFFAYRVFIRNNGKNPAQLISRHWVITDGSGRTEEVRGPGVVGLQPKIAVGQTFEYESACPLHSPCGSMKGSYEMLTDDGQNFSIEIPEFYLVSPHALH